MPIIKRGWLIGGLALLMGLAASSLQVARAANETTYIILPSGKKDAAKEQANKKLVLDWWREFWDRGRVDEWSLWMAPDFRNHDPREPPVGAQALVDFLKKDRAARPPNATPGAGEGTGQRGVQPQLFALADGDLVFIAHAPRGFDAAHPSAFQGDPAATFGGNIVRVKNGKIVEWWFTGGGRAPPPPDSGAPAPTAPGAPTATP